MKFEKVVNHGSGLKPGGQAETRPFVTLRNNARAFGLNSAAAELLGKPEFVSVHVNRAKKVFMLKPEKKGQEAGNFRFHFDRNSRKTSYSVAGARAVEAVEEMIPDFDLEGFLPMFPAEADPKTGALICDASKVEARPRRILNKGE